MIKKLIFSLLVLSITSCGYHPIYVKGGTDLIIKEYKLIGDKSVNRKIISLLNLKKENKDNLGYVLTLNSIKKLQAVSKDKTGKITVFKTSLSVSIELNKDNSPIKEKSFEASYTYNNTVNKFDLLQYQRNIENNLINKIYEEITSFLNT
tara:strand:- start:92 stop:541 length:450 start_codon:yes stop_codon:yes gene_type:complete